MAVLYIALPVALLIGGLAVFAFVYAVRQGQFDDLDTPPMRMLFDDVDVRQKDTLENAPADNQEASAGSQEAPAGNQENASEPTERANAGQIDRE